MSWLEVKGKIGPDILPDYMNDENGWPTPDNSEFWTAVEMDQMLPYVGNQIGKRLADPDVKTAMADCYLSITKSGHPTPEMFSLIKDEDLLNESAISLIFSGPMIGYILGIIGIRRKNDPLSEIFDSSETRQQITKLSPGQKDLTWISLWNGLAIGSRDDNVKYLTEIGLTPPEVI